MLQADFSWTYGPPPQQQQQRQQFPAQGVAPPTTIAPGLPQTSALWTGPVADLHPLGPATDPTFHDEMTNLFDCDNLGLFSEMSSEDWQTNDGAVVAGGAHGGSSDDLLGLGETTTTALPSLGVSPALVSAPAAAPLISPLPMMQPKAGGVFDPLSSLVAITDGPIAPQPKLSAGDEPSGTGSGEASADDFSFPDGPEATVAAFGAVGLEHGSASASPIKLGSSLDSIVVGGGSPEAHHHHHQYIAAAGIAPSTSVSPLGKRPISALDAPYSAKRAGGRQRVMTKRGAAAVGEIGGQTSDYELDDEEYVDEGDVEYRHTRGAVIMTPAGPPRTSTRLQGRNSLAAYRIDADYHYGGEGEEPISPGGGLRSGPAASTRKIRNRTAAGNALARRPAPSRAGRRTVPLAAQRIRATSARHELKGRPSFAEIVEAGFMRPGPHRFHVGNVEVGATVSDDGAIMYAGTRYRAISKFALVVLRERNPTRQSCDGWKEVSWCGEKLDALRMRVQAHVRQVARQRTQ